MLIGSLCTSLFPTRAAAVNETLAAAQQVAAALYGGATNVVLLENMLNAATIRNSDERQEVSGQSPCRHALYTVHVWPGCLARVGLATS